MYLHATLSIIFQVLYPPTFRTFIQFSKEDDVAVIAAVWMTDAVTLAAAVVDVLRCCWVMMVLMQGV